VIIGHQKENCTDVFELIDPDRFSLCTAFELGRYVDVRADRLQRVQRRARPQDRSATTMMGLEPTNDMETFLA
jgi:hypothetical protein